MAAVVAQKSFVSAKAVRASKRSTRTIVASSGKVDPNSVGIKSIKNDTVRNNILGTSRYMKSKDWVDPSGRKGTGKGVYQFQDKYGVNVDGYQPIYTPDSWSKTGDEYKVGTKGLIAWAGLLLVGLAVGVNLIISTSQLGS